ncbi:MAG TPA: hypothetical protein VL197_05515 [Nitrospirota bacterium]|nr:hypothetical protein [Nitrospirota bacterium]
MTDIILGIGVGTFIIYTVFHIMYILSIRKTSERMAAFFINSEADMSTALSELRGTLENLEKITGDVSEVTRDVREISDSVAVVKKTVRALYHSVKEGVGSAAEANIAGLKAGLRTGVVTLVKNLQEGRSDGHGRKN